MGTLLATALMRAGKEVRGMAELTPGDLAAMLTAAERASRSAARPSPATRRSWTRCTPAPRPSPPPLPAGRACEEAGAQMLAAAEAGRDTVTPQRSKIGRASWVGERTEGRSTPAAPPW